MKNWVKTWKLFERIFYFVFALASTMALWEIGEILYFIYETLHEIMNKL